MLCAVKTRSQSPAGSVLAASAIAAACGPMKPGWLKNWRTLSIRGAPGPVAARARSMSSRYCRQLEYEL